jgi:hypothetical protein
MIVVRRNPMTGLNSSMDIPNLHEVQLAMYESSKLPIQRVLQHLSADEREFILTGLLPEQFDEMLTEVDDDPYQNVIL